ncbi:MAG: nucleoside phosphorylase [Flavobacteriales bacterium]|nr:nucleoside phosphorylase [Flavobacteriales bacterium]MCB9364058.1 nucleoside phosphorylase [Flavobacteriales bacterium]
MEKIAESELVLNPDNSVYHLKLHPHQIARDIIVVGDPQRVKLISDKFDSIEHKVENREFVTHTGTLNNKKITVLGTGIGTDNIDIVINELDALVNIDLENRTIKKDKVSLNIVRIGTCGALQENIDVNDFVVSEYALGMDGLLNFYEHKFTKTEEQLLIEFYKQTNYSPILAQPYFVKSSEKLHNLFKDFCHSGITATASGFYGPQGRKLRINLKEPLINEKLQAFNVNNLRVNNFEMETSAIYGLSTALGHEACTVCVAIANRFTKEFSKDYHTPLNNLIDLVLLKLTE